MSKTKTNQEIATTKKIETAEVITNFADVQKKMQAAKMTVDAEAWETESGGSFLKFSEVETGETGVYFMTSGEAPNFKDREVLEETPVLIDDSLTERFCRDVVVVSTYKKLKEKNQLPCVVRITKLGERKGDNGEYADLQIQRFTK